MNECVTAAVNRQIVVELDSSYLYLQMAEWFAQNELNGFANWLRKHAHDEVAHALLLFNHLLDRGAGVQLGRVVPKHHAFTSIRDAMNRLLRRGKFIASGIGGLLDLAAAEEDDETRLLLTWFATAQLEEEAAVVSILEKVNACRGEDGPELRRLDCELSSRQFDVPRLFHSLRPERFMVG